MAEEEVKPLQVIKTRNKEAAVNLTVQGVQEALHSIDLGTVTVTHMRLNDSIAAATPVIQEWMNSLLDKGTISFDLVFDPPAKDFCPHCGRWCRSKARHIRRHHRRLFETIGAIRRLRLRCAKYGLPLHVVLAALGEEAIRGRMKLNDTYEKALMSGDYRTLNGPFGTVTFDERCK